MNKLKIKNLPTLKQLSADELSQVVGGRGCFKSGKFKRRGGKKKESNGITAQGANSDVVSDGGFDIDIEVVIIGN
ncbi:MAG: hypothetical protein Tsb0014_36170 [Pleurocapsa sp.]